MSLVRFLFHSWPMSKKALTPFKTTDQKIQGDPLNPDRYGELVKPSELIDIVELSPLTLSDRRTYNLLIANAWDTINTPIVHRISKAKLKGSHSGNDRLDDSINRLMGTIAIAEIVKDGKKIKRRVQLLGANDEETEEQGFLYYRFPEELVELITNSNIYARLKSHVMFCFESKYTLCLYEMVEKRKGLTWIKNEEFTIEEIRGFLNVPDGKLARFADLNKYALKVAEREINALCDFFVKFEPIKDGRKVTKIKLHWFPKSADGKRDALQEVDRHRSGRKSRIQSDGAEVVNFRTE